MRHREYWSNGIVLANRDKNGTFMKGHRHRAEETKNKISKSLMGIPLTDERRQNISNSLKGKSSPCGFRNHRHTEQSKEKISKSMSGEKNHFYGQHHSEETKRKISEKMKRIKGGN